MRDNNVFHTKICDLLEIKYPILQGRYGMVATAELAAAVSNAGGSWNSRGWECSG